MSSDLHAGSVDPDRLAELEEERRFLLRSLSDLEREHEAGDVDNEDYVALKDGYTARAANVLRAIDDGRSALPVAKPRNRTKLMAFAVGVILVALVAGWLVARSSGQRLPGDTITGGTSPNQVATLLSEGRVLMGSDAPNAISDASQRFLAVLDIEPNNVEALTYSGWLVALASQQQDSATGATNLQAGKAFLEKAIAIDPTYADAHCLLAVVAGSFENDITTAKTRIDECLAADPPADLRGFIESFAKDLDNPTATDAPPTTG
jgi:hypothetical protein